MVAIDQPRAVRSWVKTTCTPGRGLTTAAEKLRTFKSVSRREHECLVRLVFEPPFERLILRVVEG